MAKLQLCMLLPLKTTQTAEHAFRRICSIYRTELFITNAFNIATRYVAVHVCGDYKICYFKCLKS